MESDPDSVVYLGQLVKQDMMHSAYSEVTLDIWMQSMADLVFHEQDALKAFIITFGRSYQHEILYPHAASYRYRSMI